MFVLVLLVFFAAYSIGTQGLMRAGQGFQLSSLWDIFQRGIWDILGEPQREQHGRANRKLQELTRRDEECYKSLDCS